MTNSARGRSFPRGFTIAFRLLAYLVVAWGTVAVLATGLFPGALPITIAAAVYITLPLAVFLR
ncbi:MAG: hypothetical protein ABI205_03345, partial [Gemmatimonadaceae bacterium]